MAFGAITMAKLLRVLLFVLAVTACLLAVVVPFTSAKSADFHYCDKKGDYAVKVSGVEITPYPIPKGKKTTFAIAAHSNNTITDGKMRTDVSYSGLHVHSESHDLCEETKCPVYVGDFVISHTQELPGMIPTGSYTLKMRMLDGKGQQLTCITFGFSIGLAATVLEEENLLPLAY